MTTLETDPLPRVEPREAKCCAELGMAGEMGSSAAPSCPMAAMCRGAIDKPRSAYWLLVPGTLLMVIGVAIVLEPRILVWLIGGLLALLGLGVILMAGALHRAALRMQKQQRA